MSATHADIAIIGAGIAGASLAAMVGARTDGRKRIVLIEGEAQPGYHATGRSAAFWSESYGGPLVQPLTSASGPWLEERGFLSPRGCVHIADAAGEGALERLEAELRGCGIACAPLDRAALLERVPGLAPAYRRGIAEPSCRGIDVAALHLCYLTMARRAGAMVLTDARVRSLARSGGVWCVATSAGAVRAPLLVNAAGAWADEVASLAGAAPIGIRPYRRTIVQLATDPPAPADMPLLIDAAGGFYIKPETGGRLWVTPHDETPAPAHDVAPEEIDVAIAIDRFERALDWRVLRRERAWAGLRSFAPDRLPVYGFDARVPGFFWCAGQGGFGIQTSPAAAMLAAALLLGEAAPRGVSAIDGERYAPGRFATPPCRNPTPLAQDGR